MNPYTRIKTPEEAAASEDGCTVLELRARAEALRAEIGKAMGRTRSWSGYDALEQAYTNMEDVIASLPQELEPDIPDDGSDRRAW